MNGIDAIFTICCMAAGSICSGGSQDMAVLLIWYMVLYLQEDFLISLWPTNKKTLGFRQGLSSKTICLSDQSLAGPARPPKARIAAGLV